MAEIRTTSRTGGQKGVKAQRYDLLPKPGLDAIAELFGYGAHKYADHNWRNRYEWSKSFAALGRHYTAAQNGETYDDCPADCPMIEDTVCSEHSRVEHLAAVGFHTLVLLTWLRQDGEGVDNEYDDRWPTTLERARIAKEAEANTAPNPVLSDQWGEVKPDHNLAQEWVFSYDEDHPRLDGWLDPRDWRNIGWTTQEGLAENAGLKVAEVETEAFIKALSDMAVAPIHSIEVEVAWGTPAPRTRFEVDTEGVITNLNLLHDYYNGRA